MIHGRIPFGFSVLHLIALVLLALPDAARALTRDENQKLGFAIYKELVEINTVTATGDTAAAADAMAARLLAAGFAPEDVKVFKPAPRKGNLVAKTPWKRLPQTDPAARSSRRCSGQEGGLVH